MKILFIHRTFPAQFENLIKYLINNTNAEITFITNNHASSDIAGVRKILYEVDESSHQNPNEYFEHFEDSVFHANAVMKVLLKLKNQKYKPDLIYGFSG